MNELSTDRAYSILFIADYETMSLKWRHFVDTIINNLLNKSVEVGNNTWTKFADLPSITVSVVNRAETREEAFTKLKENRYDVVIVNNYLDGKPIGGGMLKRFRQYHPDALFIPLLDISQKKGARRRDGSICNGDGILNIFNCGFYNGLYKINMSVGTMINIIHAGGRPKEQAFAYYGFERAELSVSENTEPVDVMQQGGEKEVIEKVTDAVMDETGHGESLAGDDAENVKDPGNDRKEEKNVDDKQKDQRKSLNRRERRRREWEAQHLVKEKESTSEALLNMHEEVEIVSDEPVLESVSVNSGEIEAYSENLHVNEMKDMMKCRGQLNSSIVVPGALYGKVLFAEGDTVWIKLDKRLEQVGLNVTDVYNVPVVIPYTKFGDV